MISDDMKTKIVRYYSCNPDSPNMEQIDTLFDPIYGDQQNYQEILERNQIAKAFSEIDVKASYQELLSSLWQTGMPCFDLQVSLGVSTVESNWDRDVSICRDQFLKPVKIFLTVEIDF